MKVTNPAPQRPERIQRGISSPLRATGRGITVRDAGVDVEPVWDIVLGQGLKATDLDDGVVRVDASGGSGSSGNQSSPPIPMLNNSGQDLNVGDVVVVDETADQAVTVTTTAGETRVVGVVQEPIADGQIGLVLFNGYTALINAPDAVRGEYAQTSTTAAQADSTADREAGSFAVYLTGTDFPDFATDAVTTEWDAAVESLEIDMLASIPAGRVLFLGLWLESGTSAVDVDGWTLIGAEAGYNYFYKISEGEDTATATWTTPSVAVASVLLLHENVFLGGPVETHDYDSTTSAATVGSLDTDVARYAIAGVAADVASPGSDFVRLAGGTAGVPASVSLVQSKVDVPTGNANTLQFDEIITAGQLILIYAWRRANDGVVPTVTAGWTTCFTHQPYEGDKSPGVLFSKIADGSAADGGVNGIVSTFTNAHGLMGAVFNGPESATPSDDDLGTATSFPGNHTVTRTVTPASGGVAVMVSHGRHFGTNSYSAGGSSTLLDQQAEADWPVTMVYRLGGGAALTNTVDITSAAAHWNQSSAVAFDVGSGNAAGTLAGKYIGHDASATSPFTGPGAQDDAIFVIPLTLDAKASALVWTDPDLAGAAVTAADVSVVDAGGYFTGTDVEAVLQELAAKDIGYQAHGAMGATETFSALTGWHSGTFDADCTFTFSGATSGVVASMVLELLEDGTGGWEPTWPGSVVWPGGTPPTHDDTAGTTTIYLFQSRDGGTTWYGFQAGAGGGSALTIEDEGTPLATAAETLDFVGAGVTASGTGAEKTITIPGTPTGAAGGDLSGTYPNPSVVDDSHSHTTTTAPGGGLGPLLLASDPASPIVFDDILQASDGSDFLYASEP